MKKSAISIWSMALLMAGAVAFAQPGPGPGGPGPGGPGNGQGPGGVLIEFLELDESQIQAWTTFREEFQATVEPLKVQQRELREAIHEALEADSADATAIGQLMIDSHAIGSEIRAAHETLDANLTSVLSAEQLLKFEAFKAAQQLQARGGGPEGAGRPGHHGGGAGGAGAGPGPR